MSDNFDCKGDLQQQELPKESSTCDSDNQSEFVSITHRARGRRPRRGRGRGRICSVQTNKIILETNLDSIGCAEQLNSILELGKDPTQEEKESMGSKNEKKKSSEASSSSGLDKKSKVKGNRGGKRKNKDEDTSSSFNEDENSETAKREGTSKVVKKDDESNLDENEASKLEEIAKLLDVTQPGWREEALLNQDDMDDDLEIEVEEEEEIELEELKEDVEEEQESELSHTSDAYDFESSESRGRGLSNSKNGLRLVDRISPNLGVGKNKSRSLSPAVESLGDTSQGKKRTRFMKISEEDGTMSDTSILRSRGKSKNETEKHGLNYSKQRRSLPSEKVSNPGETSGLPKKADFTLDFSRGNSPAGQSKVVKKKKKYFKGLKYSFGNKKKKKKVKDRLSILTIDPAVETESVGSEEIDADSLDSSSQDTNKNIAQTVVDPYDPTDEFDDDQIEKAPLSLRYQKTASTKTEKTNKVNNDDVESEPTYEEDGNDNIELENTANVEEDLEEDTESWNLLLHDDGEVVNSGEVFENDNTEEIEQFEEDNEPEYNYEEYDETPEVIEQEILEENAANGAEEDYGDNTGEYVDENTEITGTNNESTVDDNQNGVEDASSSREIDEPTIDMEENPTIENEETAVESEGPIIDNEDSTGIEDKDDKESATREALNVMNVNTEIDSAATVSEVTEDFTTKDEVKSEKNSLSQLKKSNCQIDNKLVSPSQHTNSDMEELSNSNKENVTVWSSLIDKDVKGNHSLERLDSLSPDGVRKSKRLVRVGSGTPLAIAAPQNGDLVSSGDAVDVYKDYVADKSLNDVLCKCRTKDNPRAVNLPGDVYCQAIDSFDGRIIGCCNLSMNHGYLRVSGKIPFMILCNIHRQRLRRHNCCPGCGLFCTQGVFLECRWDKLGSRHYYHKLCGLLVNGVSLCPHCGSDNAPVEVYLELKLARKPIVYLKQHQEKKGFLSSARMSLVKSMSECERPAEPDPMLDDSQMINLPDGQVITASKLSVPLGKEELTEAIKIIKAGKTFNMKIAPKAIYWSCKQGDLEKLLYVLVNGLSPNSKVKEYGSQTGLHTASTHGHIACCHILVMAGAALDLTDSQLMTPLMLAITKGQNDIVNYLVQAGASLLAKTQDGMTSLHLAAKSGNYVACRHILDSGRLTRHAINIQDEGGWTPLVWASENRCITVVKMLLDHGANPQICDVEQNTALHWAAFSGSTHICSMVLDRGCSLRSMNAIGDTPLHIAARQNHVDAVVLLLARGASLDIKNTKGQTPLECTFPETEVFLQMTLNKKLHNVLEDNGIKSERILSSDIAAGKESVPIPCVNGADDEDLPKDYIYISENCEAINVNIDRTITSLKWCECEDGCNSENCLCSQLNFQCWYDPEGRLLADFNYADPPMIFECNRACGCNKLSCHNRVVQHGMTAHLQLFKTHGKGWGVRALKDIPKGSYVCEYVGEIITDLEADQREDDSYLFDLDNRDSETFCIDARQYANVARFINHLCEPNLTPVKVFIDHQDLVFPRIAFFANRDIEADQELGFDYGEKFWVIKYKQFTCMCGLTKCKYSTETILTTLENYNKKMKELSEREMKVLS